MSDWYAGVSVENVISMREDKLYFSVVYECLCSKFFAFYKFFD